MSVIAAMGLFSLFFLLWAGVAVLGAVFFTAGLVFFILYRRDRIRPDEGVPPDLPSPAVPPKRPRRRKLALSAVFFVLAACCLGAAGGVYRLASAPAMERVATGEGEVSLPRDLVQEFTRAVTGDDRDKVAAMLEETPALADIITFEGGTPLGEAVEHDALEVAKYLLGRGAPVDDVAVREGWSALSLYLYEKNGAPYSEEMVRLLLDHGSDVNATNSAMPPVQYLLRAICGDDSITGPELELLARFVEAGADLSAENGVGDGALAYFRKLAEEKDLTKAQPRQVEEALGILSGE